MQGNFKQKYPYSVTQQDVDAYKQTYPCIKEYLDQFIDSEKTYEEKSIGLVRFFRWLQVAKNIEVTPPEFLNQHIKNRGTPDIEARRWALRLSLDYSRANPDLTGKAQNYKYTAFFLPVKQFCDFNEVPLSSTSGFFPNRERRKYEEKPFTLYIVRRLLGVLNQRDRTVCICELQAGQAIQQVLVDINRQANRVFRLIDEGAERIRFDFDERKRNGFKYFSYISRDAIQELQKWRPLRDTILDHLGMKSDYIFITETGRPLIPKSFHDSVRKRWERKGLRDGPRSVGSHGFRKYFEQEASPPDRGISKPHITFMMGHSDGKDGKGNQITHPLDNVGGVYDKSPFTYPEVVEKEYIKLEPYINIYSGKTTPPASAVDIEPEDAELIKNFVHDLKAGNIKIVRIKKTRY